MGVCASKMKSLATTIDKDAIEYSVRERRVEIGQKTEALAAQWQAKIASGQVVDVSPAEVLPQRDLSHLRLHLDQSTPHTDVLKTALYATTNTIYRDQLTAAIWPKLEANMKQNSLPAAIITHAKSGVGPIVGLALDRQVQSLLGDIEAGVPLVNSADLKSVRAYEAKHNLNTAPQQQQPTTLAVDPAPSAVAAPSVANKAVVSNDVGAAPTTTSIVPDTSSTLTNSAGMNQPTTMTTDSNAGIAGMNGPAPIPEIAPMPYVKSSLVPDESLPEKETGIIPNKPLDSTDASLGYNKTSSIVDDVNASRQERSQFEQNQSIRV